MVGLFSLLGKDKFKQEIIIIILITIIVVSQKISQNWS